MTSQAMHPRDPELVALARDAGERARRIAMDAVRSVLRRIPVPDPAVADGLHALVRGDGLQATSVLPRLQSLASSLDEAYLSARDPGNSEAQKNFSRARAISALIAAFDPDPVEAIIGAVYEAQASLPPAEADALIEKVRAELRNLKPDE